MGEAVGPGFPVSPRRRKVRMVRRNEVPDDLVVVIRAAPASLAEAATDIATAATLSAETYVVERYDGSRERLYGVSVYARRPGAEPDVLARFSASPCFLEATVGLLRAAGFPVLPTGADPSHFDVQLLPGHPEDRDAETGLVLQAATRLVLRAGELRLNPFYAGGSDEPPEGNP